MPSRPTRPRARRLIAAAAAGALALAIALPGTAGAVIDPPISGGNVTLADLLNINLSGILDLLGGKLPSTDAVTGALPVSPDSLPVPVPLP